MARFTRRLTTLRFEDSAATGLTITPSEGDLSIGEWNAEFAEHQPVYNRDVHDGFTLGRDLVQECSITIGMVNETLTEAVLSRFLDFIHKTGSYSALVSVDSTIWAWKAIATFNDGSSSGTITLPKCEGGVSITEGQPENTFGLTFRNHLAPVIA